MTPNAPFIQPCGDGWCVKTRTETTGPLDSLKDANAYLALLTLVKAARFEYTIKDKEVTS